jgi:hypothetical protein
MKEPNKYRHSPSPLRYSSEEKSVRLQLIYKVILHQRFRSFNFVRTSTGGNCGPYDFFIFGLMYVQ